jgi:hypothetical protein
MENGGARLLVGCAAPVRGASVREIATADEPTNATDTETSGAAARGE